MQAGRICNLFFMGGVLFLGVNVAKDPGVALGGGAPFVSVLSNA